MHSKFHLSVFRAAVTNTAHEESSIRLVKNGLDGGKVVFCQAKAKRLKVVARMLRNAQSRAYKTERISVYI